MSALTEKLRGHPFYPEGLSEVPALYATERTPLPEKVAWLHYFVGSCDWWVFEWDRDEGVAFAWCHLGDPSNAELGYVSLVELERLVIQTDGRGAVVVERDLHWTPRTFAEIDH